MNKYFIITILFLLLVFNLQIPFTASKNINQDNTVTNKKKGNITPINNNLDSKTLIKYPLNYSGITEIDGYLSDGNTYEVKNSFPSYMNISFVDIKMDLLNYSTTFADFSASYGIGDMFNYYNPNTNIFTLNASEQSNEISFSINYQKNKINLNGNEIINFKLQDVYQWNYTKDDYVLNIMSFNFDTVNINFNIFSSNINLTNSSSSVYLLLNDPLVEINLNISRLLNKLNIPYPSTLESIQWAASDFQRQYNYSIEYNYLKLFQIISKANYNVNGKQFSSDASVLHFSKSGNFSIKLGCDIYSSFILNLKYYNQTLQDFNLYYNGTKFLFNSTINLETFNKKFKYYFQANKSFYYTNILFGDIKLENFTKHTFTLTNISENILKIFGYINETVNTQRLTDIYYQGNFYNLYLPNKLYYSLIKNTKGEFERVAINSSLITFKIPNNWDKGKFFLYILENNSFITYIGYLNCSPVRLNIPKTININPLVKNNIPIYFQNISSGMIYMPKTITTYFNNGTFRQNYSDGEIIIKEGEFNIGNSSLNVLLLTSGFVPIQFVLNLTVSIQDPHIYIATERNNASSAFIYIQIKEAINWTISPMINIFGVNINKTYIMKFDKIKINIINQNWNKSSIIPLKINIKLYKNVEYNYLIKVGQYNNNNMTNSIVITDTMISNSSKNNSFYLTTVSSLIGFSLIGAKIFKYINTNKKIKF